MTRPSLPSAESVTAGMIQQNVVPGLHSVGFLRVEANSSRMVPNLRIAENFLPYPWIRNPMLLIQRPIIDA
jgi:hypothetical protein